VKRCNDVPQALEYKLKKLQEEKAAKAAAKASQAASEKTQSDAAADEPANL
jgi:hypothetical protein